MAGSGRILLDDEIRELRQWDVVRVAPEVVRAFEAGPDGRKRRCLPSCASQVQPISPKPGPGRTTDRALITYANARPSTPAYRLGWPSCPASECCFPLIGQVRSRFQDDESASAPPHTTGFPLWAEAQAGTGLEATGS